MPWNSLDAVLEHLHEFSKYFCLVDSIHAHLKGKLNFHKAKRANIYYPTCLNICFNSFFKKQNVVILIKYRICTSDDCTKIIEERQFKIGKEMKDILWGLFKHSNYDRTKMRKLISLGITTFKFKAFFDVCDFKLGYVARITRSTEFQVPSNITELRKLLSTLSMMLVFRTMIMKNIDVINEAATTTDIRSSLKRPHSVNEEDDFVHAIKKKVSATTLEDSTTSRFKSVFKQGV